uniref:Uncharacterized protein n=1 Tax=Nostoc flagelliforme str. Sunitezuoqi TaxID=676037 RepID=E7DPT6_9NOSO|nr:hypothetical protein Nfla_4302 [Nostoc flagelliforme str. Sunitezuoqi]
MPWLQSATVNIGEHSDSYAGAGEIYQHLINDGGGVAATKILISSAETI